MIVIIIRSEVVRRACGGYGKGIYTRVMDKKSSQRKRNEDTRQREVKQGKEKSMTFSIYKASHT